jgi:glycosyltransferase involved in cell wall biosynthesis
VGPARDDYRAGLEELTRTEGVADRVEFAGAVPPEKLLETISEASVGLALIEPVCLSYRMSLPNKLFEYVAAGIPVLGSDLPAIGALVNEHEIGLVAQPDQVADVASKLSEMLEPQCNARFRIATRRAAKRLNWDRESQLLAAAYGETAMAAQQQPPR